MSSDIKFHIREKEVNVQEEDRVEKKWRDRINVNKHKEAKSGHRILVPFEFETCVILKLKGRYPIQFRDEDRLL